MKEIINIFAMTLLLYAGVAKGEESEPATKAEPITTSALSLDIDPYRVPASNRQRGYLERTRISVGTILKSHHFNGEDYNETHDGIYLSVDNWSLGTYRNSGNVQSSFVTYNPSLYRSRSLEINLVAGVADGYDGWEMAQGEYLPLLGVSAQWMYLRTMLSYDVVTLGFELPLN